MGVDVCNGICTQTLIKSQADRLVDTGGFRAFEYRPGDMLMGWERHEDSTFTPVIERREKAEALSPSRAQSCDALPPLDLSHLKLPEQLPDEYIRLFKRYDRKTWRLA